MVVDAEAVEDRVAVEEPESARSVVDSKGARRPESRNAHKKWRQPPPHYHICHIA